MPFEPSDILNMHGQIDQGALRALIEQAAQSGGAMMGGGSYYQSPQGSTFVPVSPSSQSGVDGSGTPVYLSSWKADGDTPTETIEDSIVFQDLATDPEDGCLRVALPCVRFHTGMTYGQIQVSGTYNPIDLANEQPTPVVNDYGGAVDQSLYLLFGSGTIQSVTVGGNEFPGQLLILAVSSNNGSDTITLANRSSAADPNYQGQMYNGGGLDDAAYDVVLSGGQIAMYMYNYTVFPYGSWFLLSYGGSPIPSGLIGAIDGGTW